jgi:CheY-like chemotaxis protein
MTQCLILERSQEDGKELSALLGRYGFAAECLQVSEASAALDLCRQKMPALIFMADQIEGMDSGEFLERLQVVSRGRPSPKVIVYQEAPDAAAMGRHIWLGAAECMAKPFDPDIIDLKLRQVGAL